MLPKLLQEGRGRKRTAASTVRAMGTLAKKKKVDPSPTAQLDGAGPSREVAPRPPPRQPRQPADPAKKKAAGKSSGKEKESMDRVEPDSFLKKLAGLHLPEMEDSLQEQLAALPQHIIAGASTVAESADQEVMDVFGSLSPVAKTNLLVRASGLVCLSLGFPLILPFPFV